VTQTLVSDITRGNYCSDDTGVVVHSGDVVLPSTSKAETWLRCLCV